jgi:hypothetical protein
MSIRDGGTIFGEHMDAISHNWLLPFANYTHGFT